MIEHQLGQKIPFDPECIYAVLRFSEDASLTSREQATNAIENEIACLTESARRRYRSCTNRFKLTIDEERQCVSRPLRVVGKKQINICNDEQWQLLMLILKNDGSLTKLEIERFEPDKGRRNNHISRLRDRLKGIQLTFDYQKGGTYLLSDTVQSR